MGASSAVAPVSRCWHLAWIGKRFAILTVDMWQGMELGKSGRSKIFTPDTQHPNRVSPSGLNMLGLFTKDAESPRAWIERPQKDGGLVNIRSEEKKASVPGRNPNEGGNEKERKSYSLRGRGQVINGVSES